jgi:hypothetical protein
MKSSFVTIVTFLLLSRVPVHAKVLSNAHELKLRDTAIIPGYVDRGCYTEATTGRALSDNAYYDNGMTVEKCAAACGAYNWFGVEYGSECMSFQMYCSQEYSLTTGCRLLWRFYQYRKCPYTAVGLQLLLPRQFLRNLWGR